jgi:hypothetical protein
MLQLLEQQPKLTRNHQIDKEPVADRWRCNSWRAVTIKRLGRWR